MAYSPSPALPMFSERTKPAGVNHPAFCRITTLRNIAAAIYRRDKSHNLGGVAYPSPGAAGSGRTVIKTVAVGTKEIREGGIVLVLPGSTSLKIDIPFATDILVARGAMQHAIGTTGGA